MKTFSSLIIAVLLSFNAFAVEPSFTSQPTIQAKYAYCAGVMIVSSNFAEKVKQDASTAKSLKQAASVFATKATAIAPNEDHTATAMLAAQAFKNASSNENRGVSNAYQSWFIDFQTCAALLQLHENM